MQSGMKGKGGEAAQEISTLGKEGLQRLLDSVDTFIFDCDGVLWHLNHMIPAAPKFTSLVRKLEKKVFFITNNSLNTLEYMMAKFQRGGFDVAKDEIVYPTLSMCHYLEKIQFKGKIEILGQRAIKEEVRARGFDVIDIESMPLFVNSEAEFRTAAVATEPISAVMVDVDLNCNLAKVTKLVDILKNNPDCLFTVNATDKLLPVTASVAAPGPSYLLNIIKDMTGREPQVVLGKPSSAMFEILKERFALDPERTIFVGDTLDVDVIMAKNCGIRSILVLTGIAKRKDIPYDDPPRCPTYVSEGVAELLSLLEKL